MNNQEYEQRWRECWETFLRLGGMEGGRITIEALRLVFDRAYTLGKKEQEKDAEGEEMLTVNRKELQELYMVYQNGYNNEVNGSVNKFAYSGRLAALDDLFGSKCLPDNVDSLGSNVDSLDPKPAEPKFKVGDTASYVCSPTLKHKCIVTKVMQNEHSGKWEYNVMYEWGKPGMWIPESDLEPYTEPTDFGKEVNFPTKKQSRNLSQETANCDMSDCNRLQLAAMAMQGILSNQRMCTNLVDGETTIEGIFACIAKAAVRYTDALIAECEK